MSCRLEGRDAIHGAVEAGRAFYAEAGLSAGDAARMVIVVEELVTNLVEHGGVAADGIVELILARQGRSVTIVLTDPCAPFDPRDAAPKGDLPPERGGGAGIGLVLTWAEVLEYRSDEGRNRIELRMILEG